MEYNPPLKRSDEVGIQMQTVPLPFDIGSLGGQVIAGIAALVIVVVILKVVAKAISASLRLAIILGAVVVIVAALYTLNVLFRGGGLPVP
jgi:hypothetical protein